MGFDTYKNLIKGLLDLIHVMALVCIDFLDLLNKGTVEFGLCELSRLLK